MAFASGVSSSPNVCRVSNFWTAVPCDFVQWSKCTDLWLAQADCSGACELKALCPLPTLSRRLHNCRRTALRRLPLLRKRPWPSKNMDTVHSSLRTITIRLARNATDRKHTWAKMAMVIFHSTRRHRKYGNFSFDLNVLNVIKLFIIIVSRLISWILKSLSPFFMKVLHRMIELLEGMYMNDSPIHMNRETLSSVRCDLSRFPRDKEIEFQEIMIISYPKYCEMHLDTYFKRFSFFWKENTNISLENEYWINSKRYTKIITFPVQNFWTNNSTPFDHFKARTPRI